MNDTPNEDEEITVHREKEAAGIELQHSDEASICECHRNIGVALK